MMYKSKETGTYVEVLEANPSHTMFYAEGGGFINSMPTTKFNEHFSPAVPPTTWKSIKVTGDWMEGKSLVGFTQGKHWNGWEMPAFEFTEAEKIKKFVHELQYDHINDVFFIDYEVWTPFLIEVEGKAKAVVYAIGAGSWCWEEIE